MRIFLPVFIALGSLRLIENMKLYGKKEIIVYVSLMLFALIFAIYYFSNIFRTSIAGCILNFMNIQN